MTEQMVTSETGGMKGSKPAQLAGIDPSALLALAEVSGKGAEKYGDPYNYLKGYDWSLSFNALQRHALAFWAGEDEDPESGLPHMAHAAWHALALVAFLEHALGRDDRPPTHIPSGLRRLVATHASDESVLCVGERYKVLGGAEHYDADGHACRSSLAGHEVTLVALCEEGGDPRNVVVESGPSPARLIVGRDFLRPTP